MVLFAVILGAPPSCTSSSTRAVGDPPPECVPSLPAADPSAGHVTVCRSLLDRVAAPVSMVQRTRGLLHRGPDGAFDGFRFSGIRRDSLLDQLGLRNGDILHAVNDMPLDSVQRALAAYEALNGASHFELSLTRRGESLRLPVEVVPCPDRGDQEDQEDQGAWGRTQ